MNHTLLYKMEVGNVLIYRKETNLLVQTADGRKLDGTSIDSYTQTVTAVEGNVFHIHLKVEHQETQGTLCPKPPEEHKTLEGTLTMDCHGTLLEKVGESYKALVPGFPQEALAAGEGWSMKSADGQDLAGGLEFQIEKFETKSGEVLATIVSAGVARNEEERFDQETQAATVFSVSKGHQVSSTTITKAIHDDGTVSHSVVEMQLLVRQ